MLHSTVEFPHKKNINQNKLTLFIFENRKKNSLVIRYESTFKIGRNEKKHKINNYQNF